MQRRLGQPGRTGRKQVLGKRSEYDSEWGVVEVAGSEPVRDAGDVLCERAREHRRVFFRTQPGNAGDALINAGFYALAERAGIPYEEIRGDVYEVPQARADDLLVMTGGGGLSQHWDFGGAALTAFTQQDVSLLILPSSLNGNEEALAQLRPRDTLLLRDAYSLEFARSLGLRCVMLLAHDLALSVDPAWVLRATRWRAPRGTDEWRRAAAFAEHRVRAARGETLGAWRTDAESARSTAGLRRRDDLSQLANFSALTRASSLYSAHWLLRVTRWYAQVETDRLHVGIACLLTGTPVRLHGNDHHKIRGVYELSIAPFPERRRLVRFDDAEDGATQDGP